MTAKKKPVRRKKLVRKKAPVAPPEAVWAADGQNWKYVLQTDIVKGDVLRTLVDDPEFTATFGKTFYSVCSGAGFGCRAASLGNCIYVYTRSVFSDLSKTLEAKAELERTNYNTGGYDRWERFWSLQVLDGSE